MPLNIDFVQILLHALNFIILAVALGLLVYKPAAKFLRERRMRINGEIDKNEQDRKEIEALKAEYEQKLKDFEIEANEIRVNTEKEAAKVAAATISAANEKAAQIISNAEKEAEIRKAHILDSAQTEIGELVIGATEKLLEDTASPERAEKLYDAFIKTLKDKEN